MSILKNISSVRVLIRDNLYNIHDYLKSYHQYHRLQRVLVMVSLTTHVEIRFIWHLTDEGI